MLYKVDWTTLGTLAVRNSSTIVISSAVQTPIPGLSLTVLKTGKYQISLNGNAQQYNNNDTYPRIGIYIGATRIAYAAIHVISAAQLSYSVDEQWDLTTGDVITAQVVGGPVSLFEGTRLNIFRVG